MRSLGIKKLLHVVSGCALSALLVACSGSSVEITANSSAEEVYQASCAGCHDGGLRGWMTDAPKTGDKEAWKGKVDKGIDVMTAITLKGVGKMPAKGGCDACSDAQIQSAVELMAGRSL